MGDGGVIDRISKTSYDIRRSDLRTEFVCV
jgi:hypothetical protein